MLDRQNDLQSAEGLAGIREELKKHLATYHGLESIPIIEGETEFDVKQGHKGIGVESRSGLPKDVIVKVIRDGFRHQGKVIQEAKVIVNQ